MTSIKRNVFHLTGISDILTMLEGNGKMRFSEIMRSLKRESNVPPKNAASLSYRLRALEDSGLILNNSEKIKSKQVRIFYEVTEDGRTALVHLRALENIGKEHQI